jgi:hypothetical protein
MALAESMITSASRDNMMMQSSRTVKDMSVKDNGGGAVE